MLLQEYNGTSLAYMGDAVMSLFVREMLLSKGYQKPNVLQKKSVEWVSAKAQARFLEVLETEGFFTEEEWGNCSSRKKYESKNESEKCRCDNVSQVNRLEAIFGWLYLKQDYKRLKTLWERIVEIGEKS